jgi:arylsulfatase A-like enzyme
MESVRASSVTPYNPSLQTTPFLDALAQRSLLFERAYCVVPHTTKSLIAMFTGLPPRLRFDLEEIGRLPAPGLPALLAPLGYRSAFIQTPTEHFEQRRLLVQDLGFAEFQSEEDLDSSFERVNYLGLECRALIEPAMRWMQRDPDVPFFLALLNATTHHDYAPPKSFPRRDFSVKDPPPSKVEYDDYLNSVAYFDQALSELFARMEAAGLLDDTVVFLFGDHGEGFGEHGRNAHDDVLWEEGIHIPLIVHGPADLLGPPRRVGGLRQIQDFVPTVGELVGVPPRRGNDRDWLGRSLLAAADPERRLLLSSFFDNSAVASLTGHHKLIFFPRFDRLEAYDLAADPAEQASLSGPSSAEERARLVNDLMSFTTEVNTFYLAAEEAERRRIRRPSSHEPTRLQNVLFGDGLRFLGACGPQAVPRPGHLDVELSWQCEATSEDPIRLELRFRQVGVAGPVDALRDPNWLPASTWQPGDRLAIPVRAPVGLLEPGAASLDLRVVKGDVPLAARDAHGATASADSEVWVEAFSFVVTTR